MDITKQQEPLVNIEDVNRNQPIPGRAKWTKKLDYLLSLIGYGIGLGKIWRFPYVCATNGGAVFLIPYVFFVILLAFPMIYMESSLGQFSGKSAYDICDICPLFRGAGVTMLMISTIFCLYYHAVMNWILYYLVHSFMSPLPWTTCDNWWNSETCIVPRKSHDNATTYDPTLNYSKSEVFFVKERNNTHSVFNFSKPLTASEEFWNYNLLRISSGINDIGPLNWHLVVGCTIIFLCIIRGIKSIEKIVYVTTTVPFIIITILLVRSVMLPGAVNGIKLYLIPDFKKLFDMQVWMRALLQMFYSMGMGWGGLINMASYNKFNNNFFRDSLAYCIICEGTSIYAGFIVFSVLGFMSYQTGLDIKDIIRTGPGLAFITYPEALNKLPIPQLWAVLFFLMLSLLALTSLFINVEVCITTIVDLMPSVTKKMRVVVSALTCLLMFLLALIFTTRAGIYVFQLVDWYIGAISIYVVVLIESIVIGWIYGADRFLNDIKMMLGRRPAILFKYIWRYIIPSVLTVVLMFTLVNYQLPTYGDYHFPVYSQWIGWSIACIPVMPIPAWMIKVILHQQGSFYQRITKSLKPNKKWKPFQDYEKTNEISESAV